MLCAMIASLSIGPGHASTSACISASRSRPFAAISGTPRVVMDVHGREAGVARERRTVIVAIAKPHEIVHAQAVQQHDDIARGLHVGRGERIAFHRDARARLAHAHFDGQRVACRREIVAEHAVEHGQHGLALVRGGAVAAPRSQPAEHRVGPRAHDACHAAHGLVDEPRDSRRAGRARRTDR